MTAYATAQTLGLSGTDAEIVSQLSAITAQPIALDYLMELLNFRGMLRKTDGAAGSERWVGTLQNLKAALVAAKLNQFVDSYELWFSHVTNPRQRYWDTTKPQFANAFAAMQTAFADQPGMPTTADFNAVAALGGGRPFAALTTEEYIAQRDAAEDEAENQALKANLHAIADSKYEDFVTVYNDAKSAIDSGDVTTADELIKMFEE